MKMGSRCRIIPRGGITSKTVFVKEVANSVPLIFLKKNKSSRHSSDTKPLQPATRAPQRKLSASREQKWDSLSAFKRMTEMEAKAKSITAGAIFLELKLKSLTVS